MIKAELGYNPYIRETSIKFNGRAPRINSLVEKYQNESIYKWINMIPQIYHDEMNGYDFELEFSGTELDFNEVVQSFRNKGIDENSVPIFHKSGLDSRLEKLQKIDELVDWLDNNRNHYLDFDSLIQKKKDMETGIYNCVVFCQDSSIMFENYDNHISVETVSEISELKDTDLTSTPLIICITKKNYDNLKNDLDCLRQQNDIRDNQIFFYIENDLDSDNVIRYIKDLGVDDPEIVKSVSDEEIQKYFELNPVSDYIYSFITECESVMTKINDELSSHRTQYKDIDEEIHERIKEIEEKVSNLKSVLNKFINRDYIEKPDSWNKLEAKLVDLVDSWKKKRTKTTDQSEAENMAYDFEGYIRVKYSDFLKHAMNMVIEFVQEIDDRYEEWYLSAECDPDFKTERIINEWPDTSSDIRIAEDLLHERDEEFVEYDEKLINKIFKQSNEITQSQMIQRTYYYQKWREYAKSITGIMANKVMDDYFEIIKKYEAKKAEMYIEHLKELIKEQIATKNRESEKLSTEEQQIREDIDWLLEFGDKIYEIQRG